MASSTRRALRGRFLHACLVLVSAAVQRLPFGAGRPFGAVMGFLAWHLLRRDRSVAVENVSRAFPEWPASRRRALLRAMWTHLGRSLFEILWSPNVDQPTLHRLTRFEGFDRTLAEIDRGRGVVVFTAHCGNWEWLAIAVGMWGRPTTVLHRERNEAPINDFLVATRARAGVQTIGRGSSTSGRELIQALRRGGILAFLIDQSIRTESVMLPFFGVPALTPVGPARLAIRMEAVAVIAFEERLADGTHLVRFGTPMECRRDDDPVELTARVTAAIEEQIRRAPEQWVCFHDRWRERPEWDVTGRMRR